MQIRRGDAGKIRDRRCGRASQGCPGQRWRNQIGIRNLARVIAGTKAAVARLLVFRGLITTAAARRLILQSLRRTTAQRAGDQQGQQAGQDGGEDGGEA